MQVIRINDRESVTTPIYAGSSEDMARAIHCRHEFADVPGEPQVINDPDGVTLLWLQRCGACCAVRSRLLRSPPTTPTE